MDGYGTALFTLNILSIFTSLLVIIAYICSDKVKTFGVKQVCKLCLFDILFSTGNLFLKNSPLDSSESDVCCYVSFFMKFTGVEGSQMVTCLMAYLVCQSIKANGDLEKIQKLRKLSTYYSVFLLIVSISLSIIPMSMKAISMQGYYCYMESETRQGVILRYLLQIIPQFIYLFIMIFYSSYAYIRSHENKTLVGKQFLLFPAVMLVTQLPIIIERLYEIIGDNQPITLWVDISYILLSLNGFINTLIYGMCTDIFIIIKENVIKCCSHICLKRKRSSVQNNNIFSANHSNIQFDNKYSAYTSIEDSLLRSNKKVNTS